MTKETEIAVLEPTPIEVYKARYGKVYRLLATIEQDDSSNLEIEFISVSRRRPAMTAM
ncbi:hypothetical protein WDD9_006573 [Paenibacillus melissococcoides]|uniref:hypothetical protein n=1 Tax=Paenibacillus melissococcoides TaxID=2912268 RepID=UPI0021C2B9F9|nr:hypothetical protein [Paenibacillus melissococcoides]CAH8722005.1 hypothetical protein WDD9_006573 [Paenibacillus melissococcoides]